MAYKRTTQKFGNRRITTTYNNKTGKTTRSDTSAAKTKPGQTRVTSSWAMVRRLRRTLQILVVAITAKRQVVALKPVVVSNKKNLSSSGRWFLADQTNRPERKLPGLILAVGLHLGLLPLC